MHAAVGSRRLTVRMLATLAALAVLTLVLATLILALTAGFWAIVALFCMGFDVPAPALTATGVTLLGLLMIVGREYRRRGHDHGPARTPVEPGDRVHGLVTRVAHQFDCPPPRVVITERPAPVAMAVRRSTGDAELVLSRGTLDALSDEELEGVIAHECAHLVNRDAWVMRLAALPVVIADRLANRMRDRSSHDLLVATLRFVALAIEWSGRILVAIVGRERERAADRAGARVTGSPTALASALATLDESVAATPTRDLRHVAGESTMSIVALDDPTEPLMLGPDGERTPTLWPLRKRFRVWTRSHPPTEERLERLQAMAAAQS